MSETWQQARVKASGSVRVLADLLDDWDVDERRLTQGYLEAKRVLADAFAALAVERYSGREAMGSAKASVEMVMKERFPSLDDRYTTVRGFSRVHERILNYLLRRLGSDVAADELRLLAGDAVHTERRARELRDLGFGLVTRETGGIATYRLEDSDQGVHTAAGRLVVRNVREDKRLSEAQRALLLASIQV